jgi:hypothetical protein
MVEEGGVDYTGPLLRFNPFFGHTVCYRVNNTLQRRQFPGLPENQPPQSPSINRSVRPQDTGPETFHYCFPFGFYDLVAQLVHIQHRNTPAFQNGGNVVLTRTVGPG